MPDLYTKQEVLDFWAQNESDRQKDERREIDEIRADIRTAQKYVRDALARYRKDKTRVRSKAQGADPWAELADYQSETDILDAYGWELISEAEYDRLLHLWRLREQSKSQTVYTDRVTEMLEIAERALSQPYDERLLDWEDRERAREKEAAKIAAENYERSKA